jgi:hypothetical protein
MTHIKISEAPKGALIHRNPHSEVTYQRGAVDRATGKIELRDIDNDRSVKVQPDVVVFLAN